MLSTLEHGLTAVEQLADGPLTVRELAERVGLPRQSTYRLLATLGKQGWVHLDASSNRYRLTARMWSIAVSSFERTDLVDRWRPVVRDLATVGETVHLAVYERGEVIYVDKADGAHPVRAYSELGGRAPAHCVATGKMLLAHAERVERERVLAGPLIRFTERTIVEPSALEHHLGEVMQRGHAVNLGEWRRDVGGIAVPIRDPASHVVAALGFSAPLQRLLDQRRELLRLLLAAVGPTGG
jgi:IclR family KDG regulon transcriptional repressor